MSVLSIENLEWLTSRLHAELLVADFSASPDRWVHAVDLLSQLIAEGKSPSSKRELCEVLSPLFCSTKYEQERFPEVIDRWWSSFELAPAKIQKSESYGHEKHKKNAGLDNTSPISRALAKSAGPGLYWVVASLLILVIAGVVYWVNLPDDIEPTEPNITEKTIETPQQATTADDNEVLDRDALDIPIAPIQARTPAEQNIPAMPLPLTANQKLFLQFSPWIIPVVLLVLLAIYFSVIERRKIQLKRKGLLPNTPFEHLSLGNYNDIFFSSSKVRRALRELHRPISLPSNQLDVDATVAATVRHAGFFTPKQGRRLWVPNILVWVNIKGRRDPLLGMAKTLVERLQQTDLDAELFLFNEQPDYLKTENTKTDFAIPTDALTPHPWQSRSQVIDHNPDSRIIILGSGRGLVDLWSSKPLPWLQQINQSHDLLVLEADGAVSRSSRALAEAGILLAPLSSKGIGTATAWAGKQWERSVDDGQSQRDDKRQKVFPPEPFSLPESLTEVEYLTQSVAPNKAEQKSLILDLTNFLGNDGFLLLTAVAIYPEFRWDLVRCLDLALAEAGTASNYPRERQERRLLNLAQLPWAREGWLPKWLRDKLIIQAGRKKRRLLRNLYLELMAEGANASSRKTRLIVHYGQNTPVDLLIAARQWIAGSSKHSPLNDGVYADFIWGGWFSRLRFVLPKFLTNLIPNPRIFYRRPGQIGLFLFLCCLSGGIHMAWNSWVTPQLRPLIAGVKTGQLPRFDNISTVEDNLGIALANSTSGYLAAQNQTVERVNAVITGAALESLENANINTQSAFILYQPRWHESAQWLADRIEYIRYGEAPQLVAAQGALSQVLGDSPVLVWQPPIAVHGNAFRDSLSQPFNRAQWQAELDRVMAEQEALGSTDNNQPNQTDAVYELPSTSSGKLTTDPVLGSTQSMQKATSTEDNQPTGTTREIITFTDTLNLRGSPQGPTMVVIPSGTFTMGSPESEAGRDGAEGPQRDVTIARFAMSEAEITFDEYDLFARTTSRKLPSDMGWDRGQRPVIFVSWEGATAYARWLSKNTGHGYRLPTEAEWEYATRAGTTTPFNTGVCLSEDQANFNSTSSYANCPVGKTKPGQTSDVKSYDPNTFGLYDTHGNVWEWVQDCWHENYQGAPKDGGAWLDQNSGECKLRVLRGGSWNNSPGDARSAYRYWFDADVASFHIGFRLARTLEDSEVTNAAAE